MRRGLVFWERSTVQTRDSIISSGRPVVIVNDAGSVNLATVIPLTASPSHLDDGIETHVRIDSTDKPSTALIEQIRTVPVAELSNFPYGRLTDEELDRIDDALMYLFGFEIEREA